MPKPTLTLQLPEGTEAKAVFDYLKEISDKRQVLRQMYSEDFWKTHKLLTDALIASADETTKDLLLTAALIPAERKAGKVEEKKISIDAK